MRQAVVRSRAQLGYESAQRGLDEGSADELLVLLREVGRLRQARERRRGGVTFPLPEQLVPQRPHG